MIRSVVPVLAISLFLFLLTGCYSTVSKNDPGIVLIIHGGAGTIEKSKMSTENIRAYEEKLTESLQAGYRQIQEGKSSLDAVQAAINVMENSELFNAGKGAVFTHDGKNELDASIMNGANLQAGAVAGVTTVKNPINAARLVMDSSWHVLLAGRGADEFAKAKGAEIVAPSYFFTERRWKSLQRALKAEGENTAFYKKQDHGLDFLSPDDDKKYGTVGCVALDKNGNLAAGTSTGGMNNKMRGRIGDSPIIGAGTYANNRTAGISCTGEGEYFIRIGASQRVSDLIEMKGFSLKQATDRVIKEIGEMGGTGGMIGLDAEGNSAMSFNTSGMYRGTIDENGKVTISMFND